jgi:lipopolysaccharide transport system ATP-binding protein
MQAKIKLEHISVWGVDTHARANGLKQWVLGVGKISSTRIPILTDVSFEAKHGDRIGVIGLNGSGKSSLLKVVSGNYPIHEGKRQVEGLIAPLIEMGAGFDTELSGRGNIKLTYAFRGKLKDYSREMEEKIIEFTELGDKIDLPLKTYSSGMRGRLAFGSAIFQDPDILLIDEIFSTGDAGFVEKSRDILREKVSSVSIAIMVNHSLREIMELCNRGVVIHQGRVVAEGTMRDMSEYYNKEILHMKEEDVA